MKTVIYVMRELIKWNYDDCVYNGDMLCGKLRTL